MNALVQHRICEPHRTQLISVQVSTENITPRTAAHTNTILALSVMQFRQKGRDGALWLLCEDEVSERLGGVRRKGEEGRQADQELFKEGGNSWRRERWSATGL